MTVWRQVRILIAVAAAYAVALQGVLLAVGGPIGGQAQLAASPICLGLGAGHAVPGGHDGGCLGGCFGCCCAPSSCPARGPALTYLPVLALMPAAVFAVPPLPIVRVSQAHRSRAPPIA